MNKKQGIAASRSWLKIAAWLCFLALFVISFQAIVDLESLAHPRGQEGFIRIISALSKPALFEGETTRQVVVTMWETIQMAIVATTLSAACSIPFTFLSARPSSIWGLGFRILLQPLLAAVRAVHPLIATVVATVLAGIGPTAGVLALTVFSTAVLIAVFSEYAQEHMSLSWPILFKSHFPALALKQLPANTLIATVLGFEGGGGIGFLLVQNLNLLNYRDASVAILACIVTVGSLDLLGRAVWYIVVEQRESLSSVPETTNIH